MTKPQASKRKRTLRKKRGILNYFFKERVKPLNGITMQELVDFEKQIESEDVSGRIECVSKH